jgi:hypothetical protein
LFYDVLASAKRKASLEEEEQGHVVHVAFENTSYGKWTRWRSVL